MDESDFEGTLILEKLAEINIVEEFFSAIDADDFRKVQLLLRRAKIDSDAVAIVLKKMQDSDGEY